MTYRLPQNPYLDLNVDDIKKDPTKAIVPDFAETASPILKPTNTITYFKDEKLQSPYPKNTNNLANWVQAVQDFYHQLSFDDYKALSIIEHFYLVQTLEDDAENPGSLETSKNFYPPRSFDQCEIQEKQMTGWKTVNTKTNTRIEDLNIRIENMCWNPILESHVGAESLIQSGKYSFASITERVIRILRTAPLLQDDIIGFVCDSIVGGDIFSQKLPQPLYQTNDYFPSFQRSQNNFLVIDTHPATAYLRATLRSVQIDMNDTIDTNQFQQLFDAKVKDPQNLKKMNIYRVHIPKGTPCLPINFRYSLRDSQGISLGKAMPLVLPPQTRLGPLHVINSLISISLNAPLALSVNDIKYNESAEGKKWPSLPTVIPQPPIESFIDLPQGIDIPHQISRVCNSTGWLYLLDLAFKSRNIVPNACFIPDLPMEQQKNNILNNAMTDEKSRNDDNNNSNFWKLIQDEVLNDPAHGLFIVAPKDELLIPTTTLKRNILWYRYPDSLIPGPVQILLKPCTKRFTIVPLTMYASGTSSAHRNLLIVDHQQKTIERYEPHGSKTESPELNYADVLLPQIFARIRLNYRYEPPSSSCPVMLNRGVKGVQGIANEVGVNARGYCVCWSNAYSMLRLLNPSWSAQQVLTQMNRVGSSNLISELPGMTKMIFPYEKGYSSPHINVYTPYDNEHLMKTVSKEKIPIILVRYIQLFYHWIQTALQYYSNQKPKGNVVETMVQKKTVAHAVPPYATAKPPTLLSGGYYGTRIKRNGSAEGKRRRNTQIKKI